MSKYNLTPKQKQVLQILVENVNSGGVKEPLIPVITSSSCFIVGIEYKFDRNLRGELDALCDSDLLGFRLNSEGERIYSIKQSGYDAVENNFVAPELSPFTQINIGAIVHEMKNGNIQTGGFNSPSELQQNVNAPKLLSENVNILTNQEKKKNDIWVILTVIIGLFACIGTYLAVPQVQDFITHGLETINKAQLTPNYSQVTSSQFTNTTSLTNSLTDTQIPPSTPIPEIIFQETFLNNNRGWLILTPEPYGARINAIIVGGKYQYESECPPTHFVDYCSVYFLVPDFYSDNFTLNFDTTVENINNDTDIKIGVQFRRNVGDYYVAYFHSSGTYEFQVEHNGSLETLREEEMGKIYNNQVGVPNNFAIGADNEHLSVYVNGGKLTTVEDGSITVPGYVYFIVSASRGGKATVSFDNIIISKVR